MKKLMYLFLMGLFLFSCSEDNSENPDDDGKLKIGVLVPVTGSGSSTGESVVAALNLAKETIAQIVQDEYSEAVEVELVIKDTETNADIALEKMQELKELGIRMVIGPYSSSAVANLTDYAVDNDMVLLSYSAVAVSLEKYYDNFLRLVPSDKYQAAALTKLLDYMEVDEMASMHRNDLWGNDLFNKLKETYLSDGGINDYTHSYSGDSNIDLILDTLDYEVGELLKENDASNVAVNILSYSEGTQILEKASSYDNLSKVNWIGGSAFAYNSDLLLNNEATKFAAQSEFKCAVFSAGVTDTEIIDELTNRLGRTPEEYAYVAYDCLKVAVFSLLELEKDKSVNLEGVVYNVCKYTTGITGSLELNEYGDRIRGNYNIVDVFPEGNSYEWHLWGLYTSADKVLTRYR